MDILTLRKQYGWSQQKLAALLRMDRSNVSRMERGKSRISGPTQVLLEQLEKQAPHQPKVNG